MDNYDFIERGPITLEKAIAESEDNTVFVQLALDLGLENVVEKAHEMGITSEVEAYPSTAIRGPSGRALRRSRWPRPTPRCPTRAFT